MVMDESQGAHTINTASLGGYRIVSEFILEPDTVHWRTDALWECLSNRKYMGGRFKLNTEEVTVKIQ